MPIYDYRCSDCTHTFELFVQTSTVPMCPKCESLKLQKLLSVFAVGNSVAAPTPFCGTGGGGMGGGGCGGCGGDTRGAGACHTN